MRKYVSPLYTACVLSLAFLSPAFAAAVTSADLSGRTICWDNGSQSTYGRGGKYSNNLVGEGTWSVTGGGVQIHTDLYSYVADVQKLPDGTFHAVVMGRGIETAGKYCK
jgi:hypothetical protein